MELSAVSYQTGMVMDRILIDIEYIDILKLTAQRFDVHIFQLFIFTVHIVLG